MQKNVAIVGSGFAGAVLARELVESGKFRAVVFDERDHIAGNCHTSRDEKTQVMLHHYGPHIFNTSREDVWEYVNKWGKFGPFTNRVKALTHKGIFSLPINLHTINQFFNKTFNPRQAEDFIATLGDRSIQEAKSFEEQALKLLGRDLYEAFFYGYTKKQWGVEPRELPASILQRLPVRFNYDDNYYNQKYQGIPLEGYTALVERILNHPDIKIELKTAFKRSDQDSFDHVFFSGPLDSWFDRSLGRLQYRSLNFERFSEHGDYQGNPVINYCETKYPYTRIAEHKHFTPWEKHESTVCFKEFSKLCEANDTPYYPLRLTHDKELLAAYCKRANEESKVTFIGRLGTYRYLDMHVVIGESLDLAKKILTAPEEKYPAFSRDPLA